MAKCILSIPLIKEECQFKAILMASLKIFMGILLIQWEANTMVSTLNTSKITVGE